jgi:cytochrome c oxidase subunit 4
VTTDAHDVSAEVKRYLAVFGALLVLTVVTVAASYLPLGESSTVVVAIAIAAVKAALVGAFFMHLSSERPVVYWSLGLTAVLFVALIAFVLWAEADHLYGTEFRGPFEGAGR